MKRFFSCQEELLFSKKKKEDKKRNKSKLKSKLTDEDIPDLADMLGKKLFKVVLVLLKVILGLQLLDKAGHDVARPNKASFLAQVS